MTSFLNIYVNVVNSSEFVENQAQQHSLEPKWSHLYIKTIVTFVYHICVHGYNEWTM